MRQVLGFILSTAIHGALVGSALVYFPAATRLAERTEIIPVELVTLAQNTNVRAARPDPEPEPEPEPEPLETDPEPLTAPEPDAPAPEREPEIIPPEPDADPVPAEPEPVQPEPEPEPAPAEPEPEPQGLNLDDLSSLVDRSREERREQGDETGQARRGAGPGTAMTASLQAMAASQIQRCTRSNADAPSDMDLAVVVRVRLERNGDLAEPPRLVEAGRVLNSPNPFLRVAGERALRAVIDCAPYELPAQNYAEWRLLEVNIDTQIGR